MRVLSLTACTQLMQTPLITVADEAQAGWRIERHPAFHCYRMPCNSGIPLPEPTACWPNQRSADRPFARSSLRALSVGPD